MNKQSTAIQRRMPTSQQNKGNVYNNRYHRIYMYIVIMF